MNNGMKTIMATILVATMVASVLFMSGCVDPTEEEVTDVTVMMPFVPLPAWNVFYTAADQGYYADEGLNVSITYTTFGTSDSLKQLAANNVDFAYGGDESVIIARSQDMPIVATQRVVQNNLFSVISKSESNITEVEDLVGKKVAAPGAGATITIIMKAMLYNAGLDPDDTEFVFVGAGIIPALAQDQVDAIGSYVPQTVIVQGMGYDINIINASDYTTIGNTYVYTTEKMVENNPEVVRKFVRATQRGLEHAIAYPDEATDAYIKFNPDAAKDRDLNLEIWNGFVTEDTGGVFSKDVFELPSEDNWVEKQDTLYATGVITEKTDVDKMFTDDFIIEIISE